MVRLDDIQTAIKPIKKIGKLEINLYECMTN